MANEIEEKKPENKRTTRVKSGTSKTKSSTTTKKSAEQEVKKTTSRGRKPVVKDEEKVEEVKIEKPKATTKKTSTTKKTVAKKETTSAEKTETKKKTTRSTTKKSTEPKTKSTTKKETTPKTTKTTTAKHRKPKEVEKQESEIKKDTKKINKSSTTKKSKKTDEKIKQIISEQIQNANKIESIDKIEEEKEEIARRKQPVKIDEKQMAQKLEQAQIMPKEKKKGIYKRTFENILVAVIVILYFLMMILGYINIPEEAYIKDLKVFSLATIAITIVLFEIAYNKDSGKIAIHGIETLLLSILTLVSMYIYILHRTKFLFVIMGGVVLATLYYLVRSIAVTIKEKRKWKDNISDVKDIVT